jgi:hypothetical protein
VPVIYRVFWLIIDLPNKPLAFKTFVRNKSLLDTIITCFNTFLIRVYISGGAGRKNEVGRTHRRLWARRRPLGGSRTGGQWLGRHLRSIPDASARRGSWRSRKGSRCSGAEHGGLEQASSAGAWRGGGGTVELSERDGSAVPLLVMVCCLP